MDKGKSDPDFRCVALQSVRWPGAYDEAFLPEDKLHQGDILKSVGFLTIGVNPETFPELAKTLEYEALNTSPAIILNQDCDASRDNNLQIIAVRDIDEINIHDLYPKFTGKSEKQRDRFKNYIERLRKTLSSKFDQYWLPPHPIGLPFSNYMYADFNSITTVKIEGQRTWAEQNRIGRLSKEMMEDLLNALHHRYSRIGRNDYFWLGPLDALAKYVIELTGLILRQEEHIKEIEAKALHGLLKDQQIELHRLKSEQSRLAELIQSHINLEDLKSFYELFFSNHPDLGKDEFKKDYLSLIEPIWRAKSNENPPWQNIIAKSLPPQAS